MVRRWYSHFLSKAVYHRRKQMTGLHSSDRGCLQQLNEFLPGDLLKLSLQVLAASLQFLTSTQ